MNYYPDLNNQMNQYMWIMLLLFSFSANLFIRYMCLWKREIKIIEKNEKYVIGGYYAIKLYASIMVLGFAMKYMDPDWLHNFRLYQMVYDMGMKYEFFKLGLCV